MGSVGLWFRRLFMLMWKNAYLRWRTSSLGYSRRLLGRIPTFLMIEVLWPIILYVIIVALRANFPANEHSDYLFQPVALPSAGTLPFMQSMLCSLDQHGKNASYSEMPQFPNASVNDVYSLLDEFGSLNGTLDNFCSTVHSLSSQCVISNPLAECQQDVVPLSCVLSDPGGFETFLLSQLHFSPALTQGIMGATLDTTSILSQSGSGQRSKRQLPGLPPIGDLLSPAQLLTPTGLRTLVCTGNGVLLNPFLHFSNNITAGEVSQAVCALNDTQFSGLSTELQQQVSASDLSQCNPLDSVSGLVSLEKARDLLVKFSNFSTNGIFEDFNFESSNSSSNYSVGRESLAMGMEFFCGEAKNISGSLGLLLSEILYGNDYQQALRSVQENGSNSSIIPDRVSMKILYTPHNIHTKAVMNRAARVFQTFSYVQDWSQQIANCSDEFLTNFPPDSSQANTSRTVVNALLGENVTGLSPFYPALQLIQANLSTDNLVFLQGLLNNSAPGNIWEIVTNIRDVATVIHDLLDRFDWDVFYPVSTEEALERLAANLSEQARLNFTTVFAGVVFQGVEDTQQITNATIKIRMNSTNVVDPYDLVQKPVWTPGPETGGINSAWKKAYLSSGFVFLQDMLERALAEEMVGHHIPTPGLYLQHMPYPCYQLDRFIVAMEFVLSLAMLFAWLFPIAMTVRAIVHEKESRLKEYIKMVGVSDTQLRISRLLISGSILMISVAIIALLLKVGNVLPMTNWLLLFLYLCLYALVMLGYSFLVATFFNNANLAACVASLCYFMVLFAHTTLVTKEKYMSPFTVGLACLWSPLGFALGAQYMVQWELRQEGLQWSNMNSFPGPDAQLSFMAVALILCLDTALYFLVAWYIEGVAPGRYGVSKPLYFPFMPSYWLGQRGRGWFKKKQEHKLLSDAPTTAAVCEDEPLGLPLGISVNNLSKIYSSTFRRKKVTAVKNLSLNFYEGQITALLGHNGAGKTTTLSILAGLFEPTSGSAHIYGNSIARHMDLIRQGLGICPQHNILFNDLTVREHLLFFGQLKGLSWSESAKQIPEWLEKVDLLPHMYKMAKHLSGGMKRKLSILLAFVGGSKTIILDEPTAGVDPYARRQIWDFLLHQREGRTIILSTHHMDEAEILGDRIAIISHGSLLCCGSFEFLKHRFGQGHRLTLVTESQLSEECDGVESVTTFLEDHVKAVKLVEVRGQELHYVLPLSGARASVLTQLFRELEDAKERLGVTSYGLTACSMEEIFIELTEKNDPGSEVTQDNPMPRPSISSINSAVTTPNDEEDSDDIVFDDSPLFGKDSEELDRLSNMPLWFSQFAALTVKRFHYTRRRLLALLIQNALPFVLLIFSLLIAHSLQSVSDPPPILLTPDYLFAVNKENYLFAGGYSSNATDKYVETLFQPCGVGGYSTSGDRGQCFHDNSYNASSSYSCFNDSLSDYLCTCTGGCDVWADPLTPSQCYNGTGSGSRVQDLRLTLDPTNGSLSDMALTEYLLRTKQSFLQKRYGGISFGLEREEVDKSLDSDSTPFLAVREAAKVWYSLKAYHGMPAFVNVMNNALMRGELGAGKQQWQYGFKTISHPFPTSDIWKINYAIKEQNSFLVSPMALMFSLGFVVAGFVLILIEERAGNVKHLQLVCGMNKMVYWLANATWDLMWYLGFALLVLCLFLAFQDSSYTSPEVLPLFLLILLCYGVAVIPWVYLWSFLFQSPATAYVVLFCLNFIGGFCVLIIDAIQIFLSDLGETDNQLNYYLGLIPFPSYVLARSAMYLSSDYQLYKVAASFGIFTTPNPYAELGPFLATLLVQSVVYITILVVIELWPYLRGVMCKGRSSVTSLPRPLDSDDEVRQERLKVKGDADDLEVLRMNGLSHVYRTNLGRTKRVAVNQLCFRAHKGECFGLLGVNGAGKTTTFKMLTGDIRSSAGDALIAGHKLSASRGPVQQSIGYCPQVDALIDQLTGRQHLTLFSRLRGLKGKAIKSVVDVGLSRLGLSQYADRPVGTYSGGNRRKLSTAIALLANPPLVLLDEPTSGVDPRARHFLWSLIRGLVSSSSQSVVLTTHSMAECEALCSRVAIMVNGEFHCLGTPQQLKTTYGCGYRLKLRVPEQVEPVKEFIRQNLPEAVLKEEHYTTLVYQLPTSDILPLYTVLQIMERAKEALDIQDYSLSQTTLDDVFVHFANEQSEDVGILASTIPNDVELPDLVPLGPVDHTHSDHAHNTRDEATTL